MVLYAGENMDLERRKFPRVISGTVSKFLKVGPGSLMDQPKKIISTQDLSNSGARVVIHGDINPGEYITLILKLPFNFFPILINGEVRWVKDSHPKNGISDVKEAGIKFVEIDEIGKSKIERFMAKNVKTPLQPLHEVINTV